MRIGDLNEGPVSNWAKGVAGGVMAKSGVGPMAAKGKAMQKKSAAKGAGSKGFFGGQKKKKKKMVDVMLSKWQDKANQIRVETSDEPQLEDFQGWIAGFMKGKDLGQPYDGSLKDGEVKKYIAALVDKFYQQAKPAKTAAQQSPSAQTPTAASQPEPQPVPKGTMVNVNGEDYRWEGQQWSRKNPSGKWQSGIDRDEQQAATDKYYQQTESLTRNLMSQYLLEAAGKNVHMEHLEDLVFNQGFDGANAALAYVDQVIAMLSQGGGEQAKVTVKWDGAPAIVCGVDPADGRFFVGTKSVFAKTAPKLVKTVKNANDMYPDQEGLRNKLILCLKQLSKLGIGGVIQGDMMFDNADAAPEIENIHGEDVVTFGPNTIKYAVPVKSELATTIQRAKMGIVFHTVYDGADMQDMAASFGFDIGSLKKSKEVWADDATYQDYTGTATFTDAELKKITALIRSTEATMGKIRPEKFNVVLDNSEFKKYIKPYINKLVREDKTIGNITAFLKDFFKFYHEKMQKEIDKLADKEGRAAQSRILKIKHQEEFLEDNMNHIAGVLAVFKRIAEIKLLIIDKLHQVEGIGTFVKDGDGYKVTNPEGFVAIGHDGGAVKLVDRLEFSKQNFANTQAWKK